jgi:hypothetical protein
MIIKSGIVTQRPINQYESLVPNRSQAEIEAMQKHAVEQELRRQQQMQAMMDGLQKNNDSEKKWTVPFK